MKSNLHLWLGIIASLLLCIVFIAIFYTYSQPMEDEVFDLSPIIALSEIEVADTCEELGWSVYTQTGDDVVFLQPDGYGCFEGLGEIGQTFYFSRVMQEELDAPTIQLGTANRNFSVFLDGVLIYTDCPEQDNRIGYLTLPMRESDRKEDVTVSLPENYLGKTLTIAQSTPSIVETPRMATRVAPASVKLYCSYAYESSLIAESFSIAVGGVISYVVGVAILIAFIRKLFLGQVEAGLFFLALTVFLAMAEQMYAASFYLEYFGIPTFMSAESLFRLLMPAALLIFLATRVSRLRPLAWSIAGAYILIEAIFIFMVAILPTDSSPVGFFLWKLHDVAGAVSLSLMLIMGWIFWRRDNRFYRWFAPGSVIAIIVYIAVDFLLPSQPKFPQKLLSTLSTLTLNNPAYIIAILLMIVSLLITIWHTIHEDIGRHTEKKLILEMSRMTAQRYENLRMHNEEVMTLRHDMNRHFTILRQMVTEGKAAQYLDELIGQNKKIRPVIQSGNEMIDIILSSRLSTAIDSGLHVEIARAHAPEKLPLSDADLCSLTMNLIDNAIEAARTSGADLPSLRLDLHIKNNFFVLVCENSTSTTAFPEEKEETVPKHGLGLKIIHQIAERYDALLQTEFSSEICKVSLAIPLAHPSK